MRSSAQKIIAALSDRNAGELLGELLAKADVTIGGDRPWDVIVHDERLYSRILREGTLGLGEAYVEGWWDSPALDQMLHKVALARLDAALRENWVLIVHALKARLFNLQAVTRAFEVGQKHYDLGNDLYEAMLDPLMVYTCAYYDGTPGQTLAEAQRAKLDLVCRKLALEPGMKVLELGCGWGGFARHAAEKYGVHVTGYTVSKEQVAWAKQRANGLPIDFRLEDYRNATGTYDRVVSIGLMEHVGPKNYRGYMELVDRCLAPGGIGFVHTIATNYASGQMDPWVDKYIFPNAVTPSLAQMNAAMAGLLVIEDVHNIGESYDHTLMAWWKNFDAAWPSLRAKYGEPFYRMWKYYLLTSAALFRARYLQLFQIVMTRPGTPQPRTLRR